MDAESIDLTELLFECVRQRYEVLQAIRFLCDSQVEATRAADVNVTLGIIARKDLLLQELAEINRKLQPFHNDDPERRIWKSVERRQECQQLSRECDRLLQEAIKIEEVTLSEMAGQRDAVAAQLQNGTDSILAQNAYTAGDGLGEGSLDLSNF